MQKIVEVITSTQNSTFSFSTRMENGHMVTTATKKIEECELQHVVICVSRFTNN